MAPTACGDNHSGITRNWGSHLQLLGLQHDSSLAFLSSASSKAAIRSGQTVSDNSKITLSSELPMVGEELLPMTTAPLAATKLRADSRNSNPQDPLSTALFPRADLKPNSDPVPAADLDSNSLLLIAPPTRSASFLPSNVVNSISTPPLSLPDSHPRMRGAEIAFVVAAVLFTVIVGLAVMVILKSFKKGKREIDTSSLFGASLWDRKNVTERTSIEQQGMRVRVGHNDTTWGTPAGMREGGNSFMRHDVKECGFRDAGVPADPSPLVSCSPPLAPEERPTFISKPRGNEATRYSYLAMQASNAALATIQEEFEERLQDEEADIAHALDIALRDHLSLENVRASISSSDLCCRSSVIPRENDDITTTLSLRAAMASIGRRVGRDGVRNRMRQGSDASASSHATDTTEDTEGFSSGNSSRSSMTSIATMETDFDEDEDSAAEVYEVRRAQTQSVEMKKGVLVVWRSSKEIQDNKQVVDTPKVATLEPMSTSYTLDHAGAATPLDASSISMRTTERDHSEDGFLHAPVPFLMVTHPSITSMLTLESSISSFSVDLNDFPHPPSSTEPPFTKVIHCGIPVCVFDNHSMDSTTVQRRSTVEQFIMMYGNV